MDRSAKTCGADWGLQYLAAEEAGFATKPVQLYPSVSGTTNVTQQYLQALIVHSSSMDSLLPLEIELADRLIAHFLPGFVFSGTCSARQRLLGRCGALVCRPSAGAPPEPVVGESALLFAGDGAAGAQRTDPQRRTRRRPAGPQSRRRVSGQGLAARVASSGDAMGAEPPQREFQRHMVKDAHFGPAGF
jgi:hypothetical protein